MDLLKIFTLFALLIVCALAVPSPDYAADKLKGSLKKSAHRQPPVEALKRTRRQYGLGAYGLGGSTAYASANSGSYGLGGLGGYGYPGYGGGSSYSSAIAGANGYGR